MAAIGVINSSIFKLWFDDGLEKKALAASTSIEMNFDVEISDVTNFESNGWANVKPGRLRFNVSGDNFFSFDAGYGFRQLFDLWINNTPVDFELITDSEDDMGFSGKLNITNLNIIANKDDSLRFSFSAVGSDLEMIRVNIFDETFDEAFQ
jgi:predicted secreted protein